MLCMRQNSSARKDFQSRYWNITSLITALLPMNDFSTILAKSERESLSKCVNWLAFFAEDNDNPLFLWRWSFYHFTWSSVSFPPSCQFLRSPSKASKRFFPNFATHLICFVSIWYAAAWLVTATTWYFVDWRGHFL